VTWHGISIFGAKHKEAANENLGKVDTGHYLVRCPVIDVFFVEPVRIIRSADEVLRYFDIQRLRFRRCNHSDAVLHLA
jgi:hypothetical protein